MQNNKKLLRLKYFNPNKEDKNYIMAPTPLWNYVIYLEPSYTKFKWLMYKDYKNTYRYTTKENAIKAAQKHFEQTIKSCYE